MDVPIATVASDGSATVGGSTIATIAVEEAKADQIEAILIALRAGDIAASSVTTSARV